MKFERRFSPKAKRPYDGIEFETRTSIIKNSDGSSASTSIDVTVPSDWSLVASDILAQKYLRRAGLPKIGGETDARQVFHRLAGCWTDWGKKFGYFDSEEDSQIFYDELASMLARQVCAPNSPQWFNTGLHFAYGLKGNAQGHFYVDPKSGRLMQSKSAYERPQPHACFIQSVGDDLVNDGGIMDLWTREARLFKYGSGTGTNFSNIRGSGEPLSGGGVSSGLMSFLKIGDRAAGAIKSGGTTRRAAKMVCLDLDHPDIEDFVHWKVREEEKVAALVAGSKSLETHLNKILEVCAKPYDANESAKHFDPRSNRDLKVAIKGAKEAFVPMSYIQRVLELGRQGITSLEIRTYDTDWNSESYQTVSGQNSNNSVRVPNEFMKRVADGGAWQLKFRINGEVCKEVSANDLWNDIAYAAWSCADPGIQFDTTINEWHTCPKEGPIRASNPCSEYMFLDDTACNLASLNLLKFYDSDANHFDADLFLHAVRIWTVVLDISVQMAQFPSPAIAQKSFDYRTLGLGYANIGALLMQMGIAYGCDEALAITGAITAVLTGESYRTSAEMAKELGAFPRFENNRDDMLRVLKNHRSAAHNSNDFEGLTIKPHSLDHSKVMDPNLSLAAKRVWDECLELGEVHGFRNAQVSVIAPTGTIGLLMDCDTTGIEPDFALVKFKKLAGGGYFKIINQSLPKALKRLGYNENQSKDIEQYCLGHKTLKGCPHINLESLGKLGFPQDKLDLLAAEVKNCFDLSFVFNVWSLGEDFCQKTLKISGEKTKRPDLNILLEIGFTREQIASANEYVCGTMTVEGAPHLRLEHLEVFDCANKCGAKGTRFIPYLRHINMMAAAQPFISGAISKTINLPYEATVEDVRQTHELSWHSCLKAIAIYRDGSKLSQPLNSTTIDWERIFKEDDASENVGIAAAAPLQVVRPSQQELVVKSAREFAVKYVSQRRPLPTRRSGYTQKVKIGGHSVYLRTGQYEDGKLGEIFLDINKEGTLLRSIMNCFAVSVSLGLQYGVPLEEFVDTFTFAKFEPNGLVLGHDKIKRSTSIIDFIFRDLAINYLQRSDLAHVKVDEIEVEAAAAKKNKVDTEDSVAESEVYISDSVQTPTRYMAQNAVETVHSDGSVVKQSVKPKAFLNNELEFDRYARRFAEAKMKGYEGDPCSECDSFTLVRNGACLKCDTCGTTTGCS